MKNSSLILSMLFLAITQTQAQKVTIDGYAYEANNRGFLNEVKVVCLDQSNVYIGGVVSDQTGHFTIDVEPGKVYILQGEKKVFITKYDTVSTVGKKDGEKVFVKMEISRKPGYLLEVSLAEKGLRTAEIGVDAINGSRIEIYNNTNHKECLVIDSAKSPLFSYTLEQGNHYTVMIRKKGYFNKRLEAHVNIDGCILCMEGFGSVTPGVEDNLTLSSERKLGTLLSNIELDKIDTNRNIAINNIYYDYNSATLKSESLKELDKIGNVLRDNPSLVVELGSHTDSRGSADYNLELSKMRASAAVNHIVGLGKVSPDRLKARGYGETRIINGCEDGTPCTEEQHKINRRTELRVIGYTPEDPYRSLTLSEIVHEEDLQKFLASGGGFDQNVVQIKEGDVPPKDSIKADEPIKIEKMEAPTVKKETVKKGNTPDKTDMSMKNVVETTQSGTDIKTTTGTDSKKRPTKPKVGKDAVKPEAKPKPAPKAPTPADLEPAKGNSKIEVREVPISNQKSAVVEAPSPIVEVPAKPKDVKLIYTLKSVPADYTGYKIEVLTTSAELGQDAPEVLKIAEVINEISFDRTSAGATSYTIGSFQNWGETERFLEKMKKQFPNAKIIDFFKGKRIE
jgi:outer membrane protein OmpA-like peptidoglycan-associated protein